MIDALGDWPLWTYAIASSLYGDPTDKGMPAYKAVIKRYKAEKNAPDPWHIVAFSRAPDDRPVPQRGRRENAAASRRQAVLARAKAFKGPLALGAPKLQCGKYKDAPGDLQRHVPGVHLRGQVRVQEGVRLDRAAQRSAATTSQTGPVAGRPRRRRSPRTHVNEILLFLLLGLGTGATIAAIAVGIVVTYRGSGFINLAAGAIAMLAGFSFWALRTGELGFTVATPLAVALSYVFVILVTVADRARGLPAAPHRRAAREARRLARRPAHGAGDDAARVRDVAASAADDHPRSA